MITSINAKNSDLYAERFKQANIALRDKYLGLLNAGLEIEELKQFLIKAFPDIVNDLGIENKDDFIGKTKFDDETEKPIITEKLNSIYKEGVSQLISTLNRYFCFIKELCSINEKFYVLPIDEEPFKIDVNARTITVPANFKKNGICLEGDHFAEILHFEVDRYFDRTDLASEDIIIGIQYEITPSDRSGIIEGMDSTAFKDFESIPGKLVFGWLIDNEVSAKAGNIKFAVHFLQGVKNEKGKIENPIYKLSTLPATGVINKTLDTGKVSFGLDSDPPSKLIMDRLVNTQDQEEGEPAEPIFYNNLETPNAEGNKYYLDIVKGEDCVLNALAGSNDAGFITYEWKKTNGNRDVALANKVGEFKWAPAEKYIEGKSYYTLEGGKYIFATGVTSTNFVPNKYYDRKNYYTIKNDYVGNYWVTAYNRLGTRFSTLDSNIVIIPAPGTPVVKTVVANGDYIRAYVKNGAYENIAINAEADEIPYPKAEKDEIVYQWKKINTVKGQDENNLMIIKNTAAEDIVGAVKETYLPDEPGWYTVSVIAKRNGAEEMIASNIYYRVTTSPSILEIKNYEYELVDNDDLIEGNQYYIIVDGNYVEANGPWNDDDDYYEKVDIIEKHINVTDKQGIEVEVELNGKHSDDQVIRWYEDTSEVGVKNEETAIKISEDTYLEGNKLDSELLRNYVGKQLYCRVFNTFNGITNEFDDTVPSYSFVIMQSTEA